MIKQIFVFSLALGSLFLTSNVYAILPPLEKNPALNKLIVLPSSTPTPTESIKIKLPFRPIVTLAVTSVAAPSVTPANSPTPTLQVLPTITGGPIGSTGNDINTDIKESGPTGAGTTEETDNPNQPQNSSGLDKNMVIMFLVVLVIVLLISTQWQKIRNWLHRTTG
jgi:hypothetical protein